MPNGLGDLLTSRNDQHGNRRKAGVASNDGQEFPPRHDGHFEIQDDEARLLLPLRYEEVESLLTVRSLHDDKALVPQDGTDHLTSVLMVVHHEDRLLRCCRPFGGQDDSDVACRRNAKQSVDKPPVETFLTRTPTTSTDRRAAFEERREGDLVRDRQGHEGRERHVDSGVFDHAQVLGVKPGEFGGSLLRQLTLLTDLPKLQAKTPLRTFDGLLQGRPQPHL